MNDPRFPVSQEYAACLVNKYWRALRDGPFHELGWDRLAEVLRESAMSVAHAQAIADAFEEQCPTPADIKRVAFNLRPPQPDPIEEWKKQGLQPDPGFGEELIAKIGKGPDWVEKLRWDSIKEALQNERIGKDFKNFWGEYLATMRRDFPAEVAAIAAGRNPSQAPRPRPPVTAVSERSPLPPPPENPIRCDDVDRAVAENHITRCPNCEGTGRLTDSFCDCALGQDLERIARMDERLDPGYAGEIRELHKGSKAS